MSRDFEVGSKSRPSVPCGANSLSLLCISFIGSVTSRVCLSFLSCIMLCSTSSSVYVLHTSVCGACSVMIFLIRFHVTELA